MSKSYLNFDLLLNEAGNNYQVHVIDSPAGQASHDFSLPFSAMELELFILKLSHNKSSLRSLDLGAIDIPSVKKLGGALYHCLFLGDVGERFRASLAIAEHENKGLRIRLRLSGSTALINVPWELLFDEANNDFLGLSTNTPVIRKLDLAKQPRIRPIDGTLRVLVMISSPAGYYPLDVEREWALINTATETLQVAGRVIVERVNPSLAELQRALRRGEYHVFHYIGHGGFDSHNNDGGLVLEGADKKAQLISGQQLGAILRDGTTLQLVLLNSCSGGRTSVTDPFAGVGQSLLQKGIPAVIAMQFEISDDAAITFAHEFYAALVDGYPIDAAVAEARKMIYAKANQLEWATPVLYTSIDGGSLLCEPSPEELELLEEKRRQRQEANNQAKLKPQQAEEADFPTELKHQREAEEVARQAEPNRPLWLRRPPTDEKGRLNGYKGGSFSIKNTIIGRLLWSSLVVTVGFMAYLYLQRLIEPSVQPSLPKPIESSVQSSPDRQFTEAEISVRTLEKEASYLFPTFQSIKNFDQPDPSRDIIEMKAAPLAEQLYSIQDDKLRLHFQILKYDGALLAYTMAASVEKNLSKRTFYANRAINSGSVELKLINKAIADESGSLQSQEIADWIRRDGRKGIAQGNLLIAYSIRIKDGAVSLLDEVRELIETMDRASKDNVGLRADRNFQWLLEKYYPHDI